MNVFLQFFADFAARADGVSNRAQLTNIALADFDQSEQAYYLSYIIRLNKPKQWIAKICNCCYKKGGLSLSTKTVH